MNEEVPESIPPLRSLSIPEIARYLEAKKADKPCEACGTVKWEVQQPGGFLSAYIGLISGDGSIKAPGPVIPVYSIACTNCGAVRSFSAYYVLKWLKANPNE